ncbi:hypothetical protein [Streptomyces longwoodensis]|uniref:hypothetical protein n=1 Tax=Streptomyces longwoodensis TaxID=68231 RepID=UPI003701B5D8
MTLIPYDATSPLRHALEAYLRGSDARVSDMSDALEALDEAVRAVFQASLVNAMQYVPGDAAPKAERAVRSLILEAVNTTLDEELDNADSIRADEPPTWPRRRA